MNLEMIQVQKVKWCMKQNQLEIYSTHACLAQLDVSSSSDGGNFIFLRHLNANFVQKCQILCYLRKPRIEPIF